MDRRSVMQWVEEYEQVWRDRDVAGVERLFTHGAEYRPSPYEQPNVGHDAIKAFWLDDEDDVFTMSAAVVAVDGDDAVVRLVVRYGDPVTQEYTDLWVLHFARDGRVDRFEEWPFWPGRGVTPSDEAG